MDCRRARSVEGEVGVVGKLFIVNYMRGQICA